MMRHIFVTKNVRRNISENCKMVDILRDEGLLPI